MILRIRNVGLVRVRLPELRPAESGWLSLLRRLRRRACIRSSARGPQDRHDPVRGRDRLDRARRAARSRVVPPGDGALLRGCASGCIERHGGTVEKFIGDAVMAVFGVPTAHEDDALRALRAAGELHDSLAALNEELERGLRRLARAPHRREHRRGRHRHRGAARHRRRRQRRRPPRAGRAARRDPDRRADGPARPRRGRGRADRAALAQGASGATRGLPPPAGDRGRARLRAAARRAPRRAPGRARRVRSAFDEAVSERRCRLVTVLGSPGIGKSRLAREVAANPDERSNRPLRPLPSVRRGDHLLATRRDLPRGEGRGRSSRPRSPSATPEEIFWSVRKALEQLARERPAGR